MTIDILYNQISTIEIYVEDGIYKGHLTLRSHRRAERLSATRERYGRMEFPRSIVLVGDWRSIRKGAGHISQKIDHRLYVIEVRWRLITSPPPIRTLYILSGERTFMREFAPKLFPTVVIEIIMTYAAGLMGIKSFKYDNITRSQTKQEKRAKRKELKTIVQSIRITNPDKSMTLRQAYKSVT